MSQQQLKEAQVPEKTSDRNNINLSSTGNSTEGDPDEGIGRENQIYNSRFSDSQEQTRETTWKLLCRDFFSKYISASDTVVDLGAGDGKFIRYIEAGRKIAVDLSPHVKELESDSIEVYQTAATNLHNTLDEVADVVFMSNFLEHMPNKKIVLDVLESCYKVLKPGGKVIILQPNIRYVGSDYWDYIDHHIALNEKSLVEALEISSFKIEHLINRFLPYTARSKCGSWASGKNTEFFVSLYLRFPILWRFFGAQTFVVASKASKG